MVLINGRRFAPSGVGGAPSNPDTNLIPTLAIQNVEVLLDGASGVYGSDAIAGVVNVELRDNFDGVLIDGTATIAEEGEAFNYRTGMIFGMQSERGGFTVSGEYYQRDPLFVGDREFFRNSEGRICERDIELDADSGETVQDICAGAIGSLAVLPIFGPGGVVAFGGGGSFPGLRFTPGEGDIGDFSFVPTDQSDIAAIRDGVNGDPLDQVQAPLKRTSTFLTAHYNINEYIELYTELSYSNVRGTSRSSRQQVFPTVPASNPFNPFGLPATVIQFIDDTDRTSFEREQYRMFLGARGDLSFLGDNWLADWTYDLNAGYSRSLAVTEDQIVLEERLALALQTTEVNENGDIVCGQDLQGFTEFFGFLDDIACVPVNFFSADLFNNARLSEEEREFLIGQLTTDTVVSQAVVSGYITGDLPFELPGGAVGAAIGFDWRRDTLDTDGDTVRSLGLAAGRNRDVDTKGSINQWEIAGELVLPVLNNKPFIDDLSVEFAGRYVKNERFGSTGVYSVKTGYAPTDWLLFRATAGSSFRSPNLNFLFLGGQSGFLGGASDPCDTPPLDADGNDPRTQTVIDNCIAQGIDPFSFNSPGIESLSVGADGTGLELDPERSFSWTTGFSIEQPWTDAFEARISATYFNIEVRNGIARPGGASVLRLCHESANLSSPFCSLFERDPDTRFITLVNNNPLNLDEEKVTGLDLSGAASKDVEAFGQTITLGFNGSATRLFKSTVTQGDPQGGEPSVNPNLGEFGTPKWRFTGSFTASIRDFRFQWNTQFQSGTVGNVESRAVVGDDNDFDRDFLSDRHLHNLSLAYSYETWSFNVGIRNVLDRKPDLVDNNFSDLNNVVFGVGEDFIGRRFTFGVRKEF